MISQHDIEIYRRDGYLVVPDVLNTGELRALQAVIDDWIARAASVDRHDDVYDLEPSHTRAQPRVRRIKTPHKIDRRFNDLVRHPNVVAILSRLIGPDLRLHGSKLNMKAPRYGSPVEWHQDWAFYPHTNDDILAIGVMLDDMELSNGPLLVVPGSHKGPIFDHHAGGAFCGAIAPEAIADEARRAVPLTGRAGSMSFHHVRLLHGSALNTSNRRRQLLLYEVAAADAWPLMGVANLAEFDSRMVAGERTITPRVTPVPVRMPLPPAAHQGSIYENQTGSRQRFFATAEAVG
ncbi:phytanoyl-CoA dioxygenase family protein [Vineibacter terrae]|uniref:Phytanoyl-CoA dioxygenase family protein n=1 Tax=Vineibacter terrae TaxID=2586908 RepID=A0A5C8PKY8_9HYPH|nr:phytanoyl-CoA dioxygenase family protein [Vineibacter terrae]TXL74260.1 phytanoyl-CoA dioxygenase family protein [Vineibacter terrae]